MTDRPIIFSAPMVLAISEGRKTMTRRLAPSPIRIGDRLWVRESLQKFNRTPPTAQYVATLTAVMAPPGVMRHPNGAAQWPQHWKRDKVPSIHMPRWASRFTLLVEDVKHERLQDINEADAAAEGWQWRDGYLTRDAHRDAARDWFSDIWIGLHGVQAWRDNPTVVAISFRVINTNIDKAAA